MKSLRQLRIQFSHHFEIILQYRVSTRAQVQIPSAWQNVVSSKVIPLKFLLHLAKFSPTYSWEKSRRGRYLTKYSFCVLLPSDGVMFSQLKLQHIDFCVELSNLHRQNSTKEIKSHFKVMIYFLKKLWRHTLFPQKQNITENLEVLRKGPPCRKNLSHSVQRYIDLFKFQSFKKNF